MDNKKPTKKDKYIAVIIVLILILLATFSQFHGNKRDKMLENYGLADGVIYKFHYSNYGYYGDYSFKVDGVRYTGTFYSDIFYCPNGNKGCVGETFKVKYALENPNYNEIDLGEFNKHKDKKVDWPMFRD